MTQSCVISTAVLRVWFQFCKHEVQLRAKDFIWITLTISTLNLNLNSNGNHTAFMCVLSTYQYAAGIMRPMPLIMFWRWPVGVPHPAIFFSLDFSYTLSPPHTHASWPLVPATLTEIHTHTCLTQSQPVDDNLVEELRKCFISQLPLIDKACVPTVRKAGGQMWPITLHPLTGQISLSDLSPDRLTQCSRITTHIWIYLSMCVGWQLYVKKTLLIQSMKLQK